MPPQVDPRFAFLIDSIVQGVAQHMGQNVAGAPRAPGASPVVEVLRHDDYGEPVKQQTTVPQLLAEIADELKDISFMTEQTGKFLRRKKRNIS